MRIEHCPCRKTLVAALCAALGSVVAPAFAQQVPSQTAETATSEQGKAPAKPDKAVQMKALSVVANRYDATNMRMDSVNTVEVLSANDLQHTAVHNVAEALGLMSGVNVTTTGTGYFGGIDGAARGQHDRDRRGGGADQEVAAGGGRELASVCRSGGSREPCRIDPHGIPSVCRSGFSREPLLYQATRHPKRL